MIPLVLQVLDLNHFVGFFVNLLGNQQFIVFAFDDQLFIRSENINRHGFQLFHGFLEFLLGNQFFNAGHETVEPFVGSHLDVLLDRFDIRSNRRIGKIAKEFLRLPKYLIAVLGRDESQVVSQQ
ncbi:MAG: hypothetical protein ACD_75C02176G0001 [uncultured bacterium]|nr:MAG: hypothetical protein ACD_75C02176G0001 [uncultured bacterium]